MCSTIGNPRYDRYCTHCFANLFPNDPRTSSIRSKSKEVAWVNAILQLPVISEHRWTWDKPIFVTYDGGCCESKRRIDLWALIEGTIVAIEIDEGQHKRYKPDYEENRYNEIFLDFSARYIFVRINPDSFTLAGIKVDPSFQERLTVVERKLHDILDGLCDFGEMIDVHHIFYDA